MKDELLSADIKRDDDLQDNTASDTDSLLMNLKRIPLELNRKRKSRKKTIPTLEPQSDDSKRAITNTKNIENIQKNLENYEKMIKKLKLSGPPSQKLQKHADERLFHQKSEALDYYPMMMDGPGPGTHQSHSSNYHGPSYPYSSYVYPPPHQMDYRHSHMGNMPPPYIHQSHQSHQSEFGSFHGMSFGMGGNVNPFLRYEERTIVEYEE